MLSINSLCLNACGKLREHKRSFKSKEECSFNLLKCIHNSFNAQMIKGWTSLMFQGSTKLTLCQSIEYLSGDQLSVYYFVIIIRALEIFFP